MNYILLYSYYIGGINLWKYHKYLSSQCKSMFVISEKIRKILEDRTNVDIVFYNIESTLIDTFDMFHKINNLNVVSSEMN